MNVQQLENELWEAADQLRANSKLTAAELLDRAGKDFTPAVLPLRASPPDLVVNIMLPPAAYILMNQIYEQGVAPSAKTSV